MTVLRQLYQLQIVEIERDRRRERLAEVEAGLGATQALLDAREDVRTAEESLAQVRAKLKALDIDLKAVDARFKANQTRLYGGEVRNPKELRGLEEESHALQRRRSDLEDQELDLMMQADERDAELVQRRAALRRVELIWQEQQAVLQAEKEQLLERLSELKTLRKEARAPIDPRDLAVYDDLRKRQAGTAVALLKRGICQACGVDVPTEVALAIQRGEGVHACPVCTRLLLGGG